MIFNVDDIIHYFATEVSGELSITQKVRLHKPSGVFFSHNYDQKNDEFLYFAVGAIDNEANIEDKKTFDGKTPESFFEAVRYFEELIKNRIPQEEPQPPSMGMFFYVKGQRSFIMLNMPDTKPIFIEREDIDKVFTPPQSKPFGRLNMLELEGEEYDIVRAKFALKYNEEETRNILEKMSLQDGDAVVYNMTPYSSDQQGGEEPGPVNDNDMSLDQIEGEDPQNLQGNKQEQQQSEPKQDQEEGEGEGEQESGDEKQQGSSQEQSQGEGEQDEKETEQQTGKVTSQDKEQEDQQEEQIGETGQQEAVGSDIMNVISRQLNIQDPVYTYRGKQSRMINDLNAFTLQELQESIYPQLGIDQNTSKVEFLNMVERQTKTFFE